MQIKKIISLSFILLIFLSFTESFSQYGFSKVPSSQIESQTQIAEDDENVLHEFRENVKISFSGGAKPHVSDFLASLTGGNDQYRSNFFRQKQFCLPPSHKLFIDFGTLII